MINANALVLTHWGRVTHICVGNLTIIGSGLGWSAPSHYLNHCWNIVNWTLRNKLQWNFNQNSCIAIEENVFEYVFCEMAFMLYRPQCVNALLSVCGIYLNTQTTLNTLTVRHSSSHMIPAHTFLFNPFGTVTRESGITRSMPCLFMP